MGFLYQVVTLLLGGVCLGLAVQTYFLGLRPHLHKAGSALVKLALLEGFFCIATVGILTAPSAEDLKPWSLLLIAAAVLIPVVTADLADAMGVSAKWLIPVRHVVLGLGILAVFAYIATAFWSLPIAYTEILTVPNNLVRYRPAFTPVFVGVMAVCTFFLIVTVGHLVHIGFRQQELRPVSIGCGIFAVCFGFDAVAVIYRLGFYQMQPLGFAAVAIGTWVLLARRQRRDSKELQSALQRLEEHRQRLLTEGPRLQQQKLESLGTLAAGIAHEINNPIQSILNFAALLRRKRCVEAEAAHFVEELSGEASRAAAIVRSLLVFARMDNPERKVEDARTLIEETLSIVRPTLDEHGVRVTLEMPTSSPTVYCCRRQAQQVLLNLLSNACDALQERFPHPDKRKAIVVRCTPSGTDQVVLSVEDWGSGISADIQERIFEPFYSTKTAQQRTGLGLAISHGIARSHGGTLRVQSEPHTSTRFDLTLPSTPFRSDDGDPANPKEPPHHKGIEHS